jgi:hypothetical protein
MPKRRTTSESAKSRLELVDARTALSPAPVPKNGRNEASIPRRRAVFPCGGNDRVYTPDCLAHDIVAHFLPCGRILEPCAGKGAFVRALPPCDWFEIDLGRDFFNCSAQYDWIVTNPPYSIFTEFLRKALRVADNLVILSPVSAFLQRARARLIQEAKFGIVEICGVPVPPKPWPQFGFSLGATWLRRGWLGSPQMTRLPSSLWLSGSDKMALPNEIGARKTEEGIEA